MLSLLWYCIDMTIVRIISALFPLLQDNLVEIMVEEGRQVISVVITNSIIVTVRMFQNVSWCAQL